MLRCYVADKTDRYELTEWSFGAFEIKRLFDGATIFLQGGDALEFESELSAAAEMPSPLDVVAEQYDGIME